MTPMIDQEADDTQGTETKAKRWVMDPLPQHIGFRAWGPLRNSAGGVRTLKDVSNAIKDWKKEEGRGANIGASLKEGLDPVDGYEDPTWELNGCVAIDRARHAVQSLVQAIGRACPLGWIYVDLGGEIFVCSASSF